MILTKCLTNDCQNSIDESLIFCASCKQFAGSKARSVWQIAFPYPRAYAYARRDADQRQAVEAMNEAIRIGRSQMALFPESPFHKFTK